MASKKASALRRLEAHNASPAESGHREEESHDSNSRHNTSRRSRSREESTPRWRLGGRSRAQEEREDAPGWAKELLAFNKATDRRLKSLEDEVKATSKRVNGRKRERSPVPEFKYKRNRTQYEFNRKVLDKIETALEASDEEGRDQALNEGKDIICERNKHIRLAEKFGWETVDCYVDEPLASDSEDEKRIRRAVKEGKALRDEKRKAVKPGKPLSARVFSSDTSRAEQSASNRIVLKQPSGVGASKDGNCFRCGRPGHLARFCKNNTGNQFKNNL
jgi:hypothetical protein